MPAALTERLKELAEDFLAEIDRLADQFVGLFVDGGRVAASAVYFNILKVFRQAEPAVDQLFVQLEVELKSIGMPPVAEGLVFTGVRPREMDCAVW